PVLRVPSSLRAKGRFFAVVSEATGLRLWPETRGRGRWPHHRPLVATGGGWRGRGPCQRPEATGQRQHPMQGPTEAMEHGGGGGPGGRRGGGGGGWRPPPRPPLATGGR